jgi:hypothetical protein
MVGPEGLAMVGVVAWGTRPGLSGLAVAAPTEGRVGDLLFLAVLTDDHLPDIDNSLDAAVGMIGIPTSGCCVEGIASWRYSVLVHSGHPFCGPEPGSAGTLAGLN